MLRPRCKPTSFHKRFWLLNFMVSLRHPWTLHEQLSRATPSLGRVWEKSAESTSAFQGLQLECRNANVTKLLTLGPVCMFELCLSLTICAHGTGLCHTPSLCKLDTVLPLVPAIISGGGADPPQTIDRSFNTCPPPFCLPLRALYLFGLASRVCLAVAQIAGTAAEYVAPQSWHNGHCILMCINLKNGAACIAHSAFSGISSGQIVRAPDQSQQWPVNGRVKSSQSVTFATFEMGVGLCVLPLVMQHNNCVDAASPSWGQRGRITSSA